jgi:hypothetical protein
MTAIETPRQVLLFAGHRVDAPGRAKPRFPADKVQIAARAIEALLERLGAGSADIALTQGAAGGDLLFAKACCDRGVRVQLALPLPEDEFIRESVLPSAQGEHWRDEYLAVKARLRDAPRELPATLEDMPAHANRFERANLWLLETALAWGEHKVHVICLWDGEGGDAAGGTAHMVSEARRRGARVSWLDTRQLW